MLGRRAKSKVGMHKIPAQNSSALTPFEPAIPQFIEARGLDLIGANLVIKVIFANPIFVKLIGKLLSTGLERELSNKLDSFISRCEIEGKPSESSMNVKIMRFLTILNYDQFCLEFFSLPEHTSPLLAERNYF